MANMTNATNATLYDDEVLDETQKHMGPFEGTFYFLIMVVFVCVVVKMATCDLSPAKSTLVFAPERGTAGWVRRGNWVYSLVVGVLAFSTMLAFEVSIQWYVHHTTGAFLTNRDIAHGLEWFCAFMFFCEANLNAIVAPDLFIFAFKSGNPVLLTKAQIAAAWRVLYSIGIALASLSMTHEIIVQVMPIIGVVCAYSVAAREFATLFLACEASETRHKTDQRPQRCERVALFLYMATPILGALGSLFIMIVQTGDEEQRRSRHRYYSLDDRDSDDQSIKQKSRYDQPLWMLALACYVAYQILSVYIPRKFCVTDQTRKTAELQLRTMPVYALVLCVSLVIARPSLQMLRWFSAAGVLNSLLASLEHIIQAHLVRGRAIQVATHHSKQLLEKDDLEERDEKDDLEELANNGTGSLLTVKIEYDRQVGGSIPKENTLSQDQDGAQETKLTEIDMDL